MIVGASPAPIAVRIFCLYASFWKKVSSIWPWSPSLKASTESSYMVSLGSPESDQ